MSEVTEFMVWRSALADTPRLVEELLASLSAPALGAVTSDLGALVRSEAAALAQLEALLGPHSGPLPEAADPPDGWLSDPTSTWTALRKSLLALLDSVDEASLLVSMRLPSGKPLSPYRLAGELADRDVLMLAQLRRH